MPASPRLERIALLALALILPAVAARAADEYGLRLETAVIQAATPASAMPFRFASIVPLRVAKTDLAGLRGSPQDDFARAIHHPGSGTDW